MSKGYVESYEKENYNVIMCNINVDWMCGGIEGE